jgi:phospholipid/cholesterol/gamma-HCH transport system permease protein
MSAGPALKAEDTADGFIVRLSGDWTLSAGAALERAAAAISAAVSGSGPASVDISAVGALDTAGAWVIDRARVELTARGQPTELKGVRPEHARLLKEAGYREISAPVQKRPFLLVALLSDIGETVVSAFLDIWVGLDFLGRIVARGLAAVVVPAHWRPIAFVFHLENFALRGAPIIILINAFVGAIVAQQGILQLQRFGAGSLTVELVSILTLRELGVLLTSIMVAGRSGSSITAEIGAMRMREEVDAMTVMAVDPFDALVWPRLAALVFALPILTMLGDIAALFGGMCVMWGIGNVSPVAYIASLQQPYFLQRFLVGLIKAPFMAMVIGVIGAQEGFAVQGSAESLGQKVTSSVVKSIFTVIVLDGLFALFFAAVDF